MMSLEALSDRYFASYETGRRSTLSGELLVAQTLTPDIKKVSFVNHLETRPPASKFVIQVKTS